MKKWFVRSLAMWWTVVSVFGMAFVWIGCCIEAVRWFARLENYFWQAAVVSAIVTAVWSSTWHWAVVHSEIDPGIFEGNQY